MAAEWEGAGSLGANGGGIKSTNRQLRNSHGTGRTARGTESMSQRPCVAPAGTRRIGVIAP